MKASDPFSSGKLGPREALAKAQRGERLTKADADFSAFESEIHYGPHDCLAAARCIVCNPDDMDVFECGNCGRQWVGPCNFDENYA